MAMNAKRGNCVRRYDATGTGEPVEGQAGWKP